MIFSKHLHANFRESLERLAKRQTSIFIINITLVLLKQLPSINRTLHYVTLYLFIWHVIVECITTASLDAPIGTVLRTTVICL